jgi:hypothetical protein
MYPPTSLEKKPQINAAVAEVLKEFSPSVKYIRFDVGQDWTGEWALFFRIMLSDEVSRNGQLGDIATRVMWRTTDRLDYPNLGMFPYFDFRSESEQAKLREPAWDPLPS